MSDMTFFLKELAAAARAVTLGGGVPDASDKGGDGGYDPVTALDLAAERALRQHIEKRFPGDGIEGEEYGLTRPDAPRRWLLDPIDGTRALICGLPSWTTLVGLLEDGNPTQGLIDVPVLGETFIGVPGGATMNGNAVRTSACARLADARLSTTDPYLFDGAVSQAFERVRQSARLTRYGLDALAYARLAQGHLDLVIESGLKPHDWAALVPVVRGAGGIIGNWRGGDDLSGGNVVAAATQPLFDEAIALLNAGASLPRPRI